MFFVEVFDLFYKLFGIMVGWFVGEENIKIAFIIFLLFMALVISEN